MPNRAFLFVYLLVLAILLTAMGGKGDLERAPRVEKNFSVMVTDISGNRIDGEKFSWEGRIHFSGYVGMAQVTIPFERVKDLSMGEKKDRRVKVTVHLSDGNETVFDVAADARCYGEAGFGSFMLQMDEIRTITFKRN